MRKMSMSEPVIRFHDVSKNFRRPDGRGDFVAVDKLSFEIARGEIVPTIMSDDGARARAGASA